MLNKLTLRRGHGSSPQQLRQRTNRLRRIEELEQRQMMDATLVADIRMGATDSVPSLLTDRDGTQFFLSANDGPHGRELWISNGSDQGTRLVKDILPGVNSANPQELTMLGSTLFFVADNGVNGNELWKSNGTPDGTVMVQDLNAGLNQSNASQLTVVGDTLFFTAYNGTSWGLYSTTEQGALLRVEYGSGALRGNRFDFAPEQLVAFDGKLYFEGNTPADSGLLWSSDATLATPLPWDDAGTLRMLRPEGLTAAGDRLFFAQEEGRDRYSLWTSDGTPAGTARVAANVGAFGTDGFGGVETMAVGSDLYFVSGGELWHSNGGGASQIDIRPGAAASNPRNLTDVNGTLFFTANDGVHGVELWTASGDTAHLVSDISLDPTVPGASVLYNANGTLYFAGNDGVNGVELWRSDGTVTEMVDDINPGPGNSIPRSFLYQSGTLYFNADDWFTHGSELFKVILRGTTDIIVDFDGAELHAGRGYQLPPAQALPGFDGLRFEGFTEYANSNGGPGNREEQILQIVAAVRENFANYNVRVMWDDRGVNSPHYDQNDTVIMITDLFLEQITGNPTDQGTFGLVSTVDFSQTFRDTGYVFLPQNAWFGSDAQYRMRGLVNTISHEAGHSFGISHAGIPDSLGRQIVMPTNWLDPELDSRFSFEEIARPDEPGQTYSEHQRLLQNLGPTTRGQTDLHTNLSLPSDTPLLELIDLTTTAQETIDFMGDRDAYRFVAPYTGEYVLRQVSQTALHSPSLTLWNAQGDFVDVGGEATSTHRFSELRIRLHQGSTYYVVAGSEFDRLAGYINTDDRGGYRIEITRPEPPRDVSANLFAVADDAGGSSLVTVFEVGVNDPVHEILAYPGFSGGVRIAQGEFTGDGVPDIITGAGPGGGPHVRIFDGRTGEQIPGPLGSFYAYDPRFRGGVFVACGDVNGDGLDDLITGAGAGGGPHVRVFSGADGSPLRGFFAYDERFTGGVSVAAGDVNGDGRDDIITGAGAGGGPHVRVISGASGAELRSFFAYDHRFTGGVNVAAGDANGDGHDDIYVGPGAGGGPHVRVISGANGANLQNFFAYDQRFTGGVRVAAVDVDADGRSDILTAPGAGGGAHVRAFSGVNRTELLGFMFDGSTNGLFVAGAPISQVGDALRLAGNAPAANTASRAHSIQELDAVHAAALSRWNAADLAAGDLDLLNQARLEIVDLPGNDHADLADDLMTDELDLRQRRLPSSHFVDALFSEW